MARILLTVPPLVGHLNPALEVAAELQRVGHRVAWCIHRDLLEGSFPQDAVVFPLQTDHLTDFARRADQFRGFESVRFFVSDLMVPFARSCLTGLEEAVKRFQPDIMIVDHQMVAGALVARKTRLPWITLVTTTASILKLLPSHDAWLADRFQELQNQYLKAADVVTRPDFSPDAIAVFSIERLVGANAERLDGNYFFVGLAGGRSRQPVPFPWGWLREGKKKLLVTLGTVSRDRDTRFFEVMMEAISTLDIQAVFVAPESMALLAPANVLVRQLVPQIELLAHMDGVVCHAGHNTVCESLSAGLPMIVAPIRDDQPIIARQVVNSGAGVQIRYGKVTAAHARTEISRLLDNGEMAERARKIAGDFAKAGGPAEVARIVDQLLATFNRRSPAFP